jgi:hypothetical protein
MRERLGFLRVLSYSTSSMIPCISRNMPTIYPTSSGKSNNAIPKTTHNTAKMGLDTFMPTFFRP